jgi:hypothetical protein
MAINISGSKNTVPAPAGSHIARCFGVIDLGTHDNPKFGTSARKILLQFELPTETHVFRDENGPEPFCVSREFSASLGKKSNLRPFLEGWRGRSFSDDELKKFDISVLAGQPCLLSVVHAQNGEKTYANIAGAMKIPKGMVVPDPINKTVTFSLEEGDYDEAVLNALPEWIRTKVGESPEYKSIASDSPPTTGDGLTDEDLDQSIPF